MAACSIDASIWTGHSSVFAPRVSSVRSSAPLSRRKGDGGAAKATKGDVGNSDEAKKKRARAAAGKKGGESKGASGAKAAKGTGRGPKTPAALRGTKKRAVVLTDSDADSGTDEDSDGPTTPIASQR